MAADGQSGQILLGDRPFRPVTPSLWAPELRLQALDAQGIDLQIVSTTPVIFGYAWEPARAALWCAQMNGKALPYCATDPQRLKCLAQVPLQDIRLACEETQRAMAAGCVGVQIGNHIGERDLDHPEMLDDQHFCSKAGVPLLVHPWDMLGGPARMK